VVCDDVNRGGGAFKVVVPVPECLEDGKEFLIVGVIVQLRSSQGLGVVGDQTNLSVGASDRQDASDGIVRGIHFHDDRGVWNRMGKDGCSGEGMLESIEGTLTVLREIPRSVFPGEPGKWNHDVQVIEYKLAVEIGKAQEGLDVLHLSRFRPVGDSLDFVSGHSQTIRGEAIAKVLYRVQVELTFLQFGEEAMQPEMAEHFPDMLLVGLHILGVDEDVVKVHDNADIQHVSKDSVDKTLECCRGISEAKGHY